MHDIFILVFWLFFHVLIKCEIYEYIFEHIRSGSIMAVIQLAASMDTVHTIPPMVSVPCYSEDYISVTLYYKGLLLM